MDLSLPRKSFNIQSFIENSQHSCRALLRCRQGVCEALIYQISPTILVAFFDFRAKVYRLNPNRRGHILEINYCTHGRAEHVLSDGTFCYVGKNDLVFNLESSHTAEINMPLGYYQGLGFVFDLSQPRKMDMREFSCDVTALSERILSYGGELYISADSQLLNLCGPPDDWPEEAKLVWLRLKVQELLLYAQQYRFDLVNRQKFYERQLVETIKDVQKMIVGDLRSHYTIEYLAKAHFISPSKLKQTFKDIYGESIGAYMKHIRMKQAAEWLRESDKSIAEISGLLGYQSISKFSAAFKSVMKDTPAAYRKNPMSREENQCDR